MASSAEYLEYVLDLLADVPEVSHRKMMGEYLLYASGKLFGGVYDDRFLVKSTESSRAALGARRALRGRCGDAARGRGGQSRRAHHRGGHASGAARAEEAPGVDSRGSAYRRRHQLPVPAHMAIAPSPCLETEALLGLLQETS